MLTGLAAQLGLASQVDFLGKLSSAEMPEFYQSIDVLVLPSRTTRSWKEQFGRVLVEAMASGVPVAGSNSGEIPHVIGDSGVVFPENDVTALATLLAQFATDPAQRAALAARGRARVLARYTQERIAQATYAVYRGILNESAATVVESSAREEQG
jgi:glycosyltransferase involved in cell wall biosynthesis